jgi:hypothetical protein
MKDSFRMFAPLAAAAWPLVSPGKTTTTKVVSYLCGESAQMYRHPIWRAIFFFK